jgi:hypothetical protein
VPEARFSIALQPGDPAIMLVRKILTEEGAD